MVRFIRRVRRHTTAAAVGLGLVAAGVGVGAATVASPGASEVADVSQVTETVQTTTPETTSSPPTTTTQAPPPGDPVMTEPTGTVQDVTEAPQPAPQDTQAPAPEQPVELPEGHRLPDLAPDQDPEGVGTVGPDGRYTPAPPRQNPGEPAPGPDWGPSPVEPDTEPEDIG